MSELAPEEESDSKDKELLDRAISILMRVTRGYPTSEKCQCALCEARKFLNEIV